MKNDADESQPPAVAPDPAAPRIREGLYILTNKRSRTTLDLLHGHSAPGTHVIGYEQHVERENGNQLWLIKQEGINEAYTLRNLFGGTYLHLEGGNRNNGSPVVGWPREKSADSRANQEWRIEDREPHYYTLRCSQTDTMLEIPGGDPSNFVRVTCSTPADENNHQLWSLELASRTGEDIKGLFRMWKPNLLPQIFQLYGESAQYFVLRTDVRRKVWEETKLLRQPILSHFFDYDDFVIRMKDATTHRVRNHFQADIRGYSIVFGIIYGEERNGPRAYNWYLSPDMCSLVFFDPQSGKEYGPAALDGFGFEPTFATF